ncbi:MAG: helix-turn-helix domain-containing protein [Planctomycetota bacterium]
MLDAKAAAALLSIGARTLWSLSKCNAIPNRRIGRSVRYCPVELQAWVAAGCPIEPGAATRVLKAVAR